MIDTNIQKRMCFPWISLFRFVAVRSILALLICFGLRTAKADPDDLVPAVPACFSYKWQLDELLALRGRLRLDEKDEAVDRIVQIMWLPEGVEPDYVFLALNRRGAKEDASSDVRYEMEVRYAAPKNGPSVIQRLSIDDVTAQRMAKCWKQMCLRAKYPAQTPYVLAGEYYAYSDGMLVGGWMVAISTKGKLFNMTHAAYYAAAWVRSKGTNKAAKDQFESSLSELETLLKLER
jgi:hypothetical protein